MPRERLWPRHGEDGAATLLPGSARPGATLIAAVSIAILTNGPSIALSHRYNVQLGWERWPYILPMGGVAVLSAFLCGRDLTLEDVRRSCWPLVALAAYLLWSVASVTWSVAPDATAVRILVTTGVSAFGVWYVLGLCLREQLLSVFVATAVLSVWSLALILLQPHTHQIYPPAAYPEMHTAVFGVFGNPNSLGPVAALSVLSSIGTWVFVPRPSVRIAAAVVAPIGVLLTLWSQCETAIAGLILGLLIICASVVLPVVRRVSGWVVGGSIVVAVIVLWRVFFDNIARITPAIGSDITLSSRRLIWQDVRAAIALRPWRGYGFFAYWDNQALTAATYQRVGKAYGSAHNSVLEVALGLGRVGLVVYLAMALFMIVGTARWIWWRTTPASVTWVVVAGFLVAQNSMESFVLWHSYLWALFVAATIAPSALSEVRFSTGGGDVVAGATEQPFAPDHAPAADVVISSRSR